MPRWTHRTYPADIGSGEIYDREYAWEYDGHRFTWSLNLPEALYRARKNRTRIYDYGAYVADDLTQRTFRGFCENLESQRRTHGFTPRETAEFVARFVQHLEYTPDQVSTDYDNYPRYPIETLVDETGDCEDSSLLLATLLYGMGFQVGLLEFDSHLGVGVVIEEMRGNIEFDGTDYAYIEATDSGWEPGEVPRRYEGQAASLHRIDESPVVHAVWQAASQDDMLVCSGAVLNTGEGVAENVGFELTLTDGQGQCIETLWQEWESLAPGTEGRWRESVPMDSDTFVEPQWTLAIDRVIHDEGAGEGKWL